MDNRAILEIIRDRSAWEQHMPPHVRNLRFHETLKLESFDTGVARCVWTPTEDFAIPGPGGFIFGGYVAAVTDSVAHFCMLTILPGGRMYSTADLRVSYFRPFTERSYRIEARRVTQTRTQAHVEVEFLDAKGAMAAKATLVQRIRPGEEMPAAR